MSEAAAQSTQFVRVRLPRLRRPVHVLREAIASEDDFWAGADRLLAFDGSIQAAHSRSRLLRRYRELRGVEPEPGSVLVLDAVRVGRALGRPHCRWTGTTRGTLVEMDDLLWDAAATLGATDMGKEIRDPKGFHAQYLYVWGDRPEPLPQAQRQARWRAALTWLTAHTEVLDEHDARLLKRG